MRLDPYKGISPDEGDGMGEDWLPILAERIQAGTLGPPNHTRRWSEEIERAEDR